MELIKWSDLYSVKNSIIDEQHKKLISIINELFTLISSRNNQRLEEIISDLVKYTNYHFKTEEEILDKYNYFEKDEHIKQHKQFLNQILEFNDDFLNGKIQLKFEVFSFLKDWLLKHIIGSDKKYMNYFKINDYADYFK